MVVLGVNIIYQPEMLIPVVSAVFIIFGALLFILGLVVSRVSSMASGMMGGGLGGMPGMPKSGGAKAGGDGVRVFSANSTFKK